MKEKTKAAFVQQLKALNEQFAGWIQEQAAGHPTEVWTDGVEDYVRYSKQLLEDFKDVLDQPEAAPPAAAAPLGGSIFGAAPASGFSLGGAFGAAPAFGTASGGAFGGAGTGAMGGFFGAPAAVAEEEEEEEAEEEEPLVQLEPADADILAKQRVQLLTLVNDSWKDKGRGTVTVRRPTGEASGKQPYIVFTTDSGRILINAPLVKNMKPITNPKTPRNIVMLLFSSVDGSEERSSNLFKCESPEAMQALLAVITENV